MVKVTVGPVKGALSNYVFRSSSSGATEPNKAYCTKMLALLMAAAACLDSASKSVS